MLDKEFKYYLDNQKELLTKFQERFIVIIGKEVIGDYSTAIAALEETVKTHKIGTFLIQKCSPGKDDYSETYHTRVIFG